jgi:hypothetical protein
MKTWNIAIFSKTTNIPSLKRRKFFREQRTRELVAACRIVSVHLVNGVDGVPLNRKTLPPSNPHANFGFVGWKEQQQT